MVILVADDDPSVRVAIRRLLRDIAADVDVREAEDGAEACRIIDSAPIDVVLTDLSMPHADGFAVLARARARRPGVPVLMLTAQGSIRHSVRAIREGAYDFLAKPFHPDELLATVRSALRESRSASTSGRTRPAAGKVPERDHPQAALVGDSAALRAVLATIEQVAPSDATVLISGESGSGKEVVARLIHGQSRRAGRPFVPVNCGAIPENLVESELFGHARGAFTGALEARIGRFAQADGGTLFLDEIGELAPPVQVKLLRVLQEREVQPLGETRSHRVDVRVIAATHRDLEAMVATGRFRQDLYFRLAVMPLPVPALRERAEDLPALIRHFLVGACGRSSRSTTFSPEALAVLKLYDWPGNVRELENLVERLVILDRKGTVEVDDLPVAMRQPPGRREAEDGAGRLARGQTLNLDESVGRLEGSLIDEAMTRAKGNKSEAARLLGIKRTTLIDRLGKRSRKGPPGGASPG